MNSQEGSTVTVRSARAEDREPVLAFCRTTWAWGEDYIARVWDEWLDNPNGRLFVATFTGQPVGIFHVRMLTKTDAWLEGMRVDPEYRRQGVATALYRAALLEAMQRGASYARLITESTNTAFIHFSEQAAMRRIGVLCVFNASGLELPSRREQALQQTQVATMADLDEIIDYLNVSNIFPTVGGLYYTRYAGSPITVEQLEHSIATQHLYLLRRWNRLDGLAIAQVQETSSGQLLSLGYIDGTSSEAIGLIAYDIRSRLSEFGVQTVRAYAPDLMLVRDAFLGAEYVWDGIVFYAYERGLV